MFIGITGMPFCGKHTVAHFLVQQYGFHFLALRHGVTHNARDFGDVEEFEAATDMLNYVTKRWTENFVTCDVIDLETLKIFRKRPFFLLIAVECPVTIRYQRAIERFRSTGREEPTFESFVTTSDAALFNLHPTNPKEPNSTTPLYTCQASADITVVNRYTTLAPLHAELLELDLANPERIRPSWDAYFMHLSDLAARRSNCMKRRVGCIIVKDGRVVATGYNGTPRGLPNCNEGGCPRCNAGTGQGAGLDKCLCLHAEENALLEAGRERVGVNSILYCNTCPCLGCAIKIIQTGIHEVVFARPFHMDEESIALFRRAGVVVRQHLPPSMKLETQRFI
ncbi:uncharacterized protein VTP21DRAFT_9199 [Calcarisporiella thermophila]|uniref:uncharacterized protein n=1 Tax=Calcarisporiella thermophila TaxID=911321 RepID=UPI00374288F0